MCESVKALPQRNLFHSSAIRLAFALSCVVGLAPYGNQTFAGSGSRLVSSTQVTSQFAVEDFDGDGRPDLATVQGGQSGAFGTRYSIDFRLSTGLQQTVVVTALTGGLQLTSRDVNSDHFLDVIVTTSWTNHPVAVLLNDGRGKFTEADPSAFSVSLTTSEGYRVSATDAIQDAIAALVTRYTPGQCEESFGSHSPHWIIESLVPGAILFITHPGGNSFFGRAPPSLELQH